MRPEAKPWRQRGDRLLAVMIVVFDGLVAAFTLIPRRREEARRRRIVQALRAHPWVDRETGRLSPA